MFFKFSESDINDISSVGDFVAINISYHSSIRYRILVYINMIRYWIKVVNMNDNKYVTMVYNMLLNDLQINENKKSWVSGIKNTLQ